jgi:hypothetical protein
VLIELPVFCDFAIIKASQISLALLGMRPAAQ